MRRSINALEHHYIVCGAGRTGWHMIRELLETQRALVLIDLDEPKARALLEELQADFSIVIGDAIDDEILRKAGIDRAKGLCVATPQDKENLLITVTARMIRGDLRIVARCTDEKVYQKLQQAGADAVVSPNTIGLSRILAPVDRAQRSQANPRLRLVCYNSILQVGHDGANQLVDWDACVETQIGDGAERGNLDLSRVLLRRCVSRASAIMGTPPTGVSIGIQKDENERTWRERAARRLYCLEMTETVDNNTFAVPSRAVENGVAEPFHAEVGDQLLSECL
nr:NAD(P)-binding protein [Enhygromyxa salina]